MEHDDAVRDEISSPVWGALGLMLAGFGVGAVVLLLVGPGAAPVNLPPTPAPPGQELAYLPPHAADAPPEIAPLVARGRRILDHTRRELPDATGSRLDCSSCHFNAGRTDGGVDGGISLVGVAAARVDLARRVNECVVANLGGRPLPVDGPEMEAILVYLTWISSEIPVLARPPWLGLPELEAPDADPSRGEEIWRIRCAPCHGVDGSGTAVAPPAWGPGSFTTASAMRRPELLASFVALNMPRQNPILEPAEAAAVAAWVASRPRPEPG